MGVHRMMKRSLAAAAAIKVLLDMRGAAPVSLRVCSVIVNHC